MRPDRRPPSYPRARIDALTDGIFAVAMTLLVLDIRLPEGFQPETGSQLLSTLLELWPKFLIYGMSFLILGLRWLSLAQIPVKGETLSGRCITWWLFYLLLITCVPFSTLLVGRYASWPPALWVYCGNTALIVLASWNLNALLPSSEDPVLLRRRQISLGVLLLSTALCVIWSFINPRHAIWGLAINLAAPRLARLTER